MGASRGVLVPLPPDVTSFIGRAGQIRAVTELLARTRLVTLTGPGGVGKTRLALRTAHGLAPAHADEVALVELAELSDPRLVTGAVAAALGLPDRLTEWAVADLVDHIGGRGLLLLMDNCEHLVDACAAVVDELLRSNPELSVLATSRQPLGVSGEHLLVVPALSMPASDDEPPDSLRGYEAVSLFVERAAAATGRFVLDAGNTADVARLCQRLDGIPLAIEMAAARLRVLALPQLVQRLDDRFTVLTGGPRASVPRQRTLQSTVDWSFDLCTAHEQRAWSVLSVFEGGFELEAAEHVCAGAAPPSGGAQPAVLDLVSALVDKSVLMPEDHGGRVRYRMLETIRSYGLGRLAASGEESSARGRHRDWFVGLAVHAGAVWFGPDQATWVGRLHADQANLRAAMQLSLDRGSPQLALRVASSVWFYWLGWGSLEEGRRWLSAALAADVDRSDVELRVRALRHLATLGAIHGDPEGAHAALLRARDEAASGTGLRLRADGLRAAALAAAVEHDHLGCIELFETVLGDPSVSADEPEATAFDLEVLVTVLTLVRQGEQAIVHARRGLRICAEHREDWHRGYLLCLYGTELWLQGSYDAARRAGRESLALARSLEHAFGTLSALELLAWVATSTGDLERAAVLFGALAPMWRAIGAPSTGSGQVPLYHEMCRARLVDALGAAAYGKAVRRGGDLSMEEAVSFCLGGSARPAKKPARTRGGRGGLTRRELEIAELVARGMTNQQIAETLVISRRTAEGHVQRVLDKLGFRSRARIATWVAGRGGAARD